MIIYGPIPAICRIKDCNKEVYPRPYQFRIGEFWTEWWFCEEHYEECCDYNLDRDMAYLEEQSNGYVSGGW